MPDTQLFLLLKYFHNKQWSLRGILFHVSTLYNLHQYSIWFLAWFSHHNAKMYMGKVFLGLFHKYGDCALFKVIQLLTEPRLGERNPPGLIRCFEKSKISLWALHLAVKTKVSHGTWSSHLHKSALITKSPYFPLFVQLYTLNNWTLIILWVKFRKCSSG